MDEIWKPVVGFEGRYEVSDLGNVRSLLRCKKGETRVLRQQLSPTGYRKVPLCSRVRPFERQRYVHVLVAQAFLPAVEGKAFVNHKDANRQNNNVLNLEWCTLAENIQYGIRLGRYEAAHSLWKNRKRNALGQFLPMQ